MSVPAPNSAPPAVGSSVPVLAPTAPVSLIAKSKQLCMTRKFVIGGAVVIILLLVACHKLTRRRKAHGLSQRLGAAGWSLFTMAGCPACVQQKKILGDMVGLQEVGGPTAPAPPAAGLVALPAYSAVKMFPFWFSQKTGAGVPGVQSLEQLMKMAN